MGRRSRRYEVEFMACLIAVGPHPSIPRQDSRSPLSLVQPGSEQWVAVKRYQADVMNWWYDWHGAQKDKPTNRSKFRFYKKFRTWQKIYLRRTEEDESVH